MAEKIMMPHEQLASPLLPVPVEKKKQQQKPTRAFPPFPAVRLVSLWGLFNAGVLDLPSWLVQPADLTEAEVATASALMLGTIWGTVIQAAAATPALLLPAHRRRTRRALAYTVLAAAVASHCMNVSALGIYRTTGPGYPAFIRINCFVCFFILAVSDLLCFLALLVGNDEDE
ncbi:unnamed protein product [Urochloa decumbens]|uniref:Uncharacterized protein n=1 Tax=Urochloa decumbens TaxID=240449 RepID=A0ABC8ZSU0_9POAL